MKTRTTVLIAVAAAVGAADIVAAHSVYVKKKAAVLRDMAVMSLDEALRQKSESPDTEAVVIPID